MSEYMSDQEIYDQFAEAAAALIMRQYAAAAGKTVMKTTPDQKTSDALDAKCRKQIKKNLRKQQIKIVAKTVLRYTKRVAMVVLMLFGVVGILFTTVEAVRVPIINFFIEQKDGYLEISGMEGEKKPSEERETTAKNPLDGLLPEGYKEVLYEKPSSGGFTSIFENDRGKYILFTETTLDSNLEIDNEDTITEYITILSYEAVLIQKGGYRLVWLNTDIDRMYCIDTDALSREEIISLAEKNEKNR